MSSPGTSPIFQVPPPRALGALLAQPRSRRGGSARALFWLFSKTRARPCAEALCAAAAARAGITTAPAASRHGGLPAPPGGGCCSPAALPRGAVTGEGGARLLASSQCHQCLHPVTQAQGASRGMGGKQICSLLRAGGGRVPHVVMESGCPGAVGPCPAQVGGDQQGRPPQGLCTGLPGCPQPILGGSGCPLLAQ